MTEKLKKAAVWILLTAGALVMMFPFIWMLAILKDASGSHCHSAYALSCKGCLCKLCGSFHHGAFWTVPF